MPEMALFHSLSLDMRLVIANSYPTRANGIIVKYLVNQHNQNGVLKLRRNNGKNYVNKRLVSYSFCGRINLAQKASFLQPRIELDVHLVLFSQAQSTCLSAFW